MTSRELLRLRRGLRRRVTVRRRGRRAGYTAGRLEIDTHPGRQVTVTGLWGDCQGFAVGQEMW